jgi:hypothetical protein
MSENQEKQVSAVPTDAVVAYLSDIYRQLDAISFNIRTNITNIMPKVEGEVTHASSAEDEVR